MPSEGYTLISRLGGQVASRLSNLSPYFTFKTATEREAIRIPERSRLAGAYLLGAEGPVFMAPARLTVASAAFAGHVDNRWKPLIN
ncbi:hypothetical protein EVAR_14357_1 [Eumeta japonica]|uniref:Uncharacterized protein n=1 Tax=Eumeta variegata TaxID=151549 RepID=A0A4C1TX44_EUMVA|nr:hypothetical protein EVAR_14357_1 [Eumeta japonica]